jgi:[ribosomal protein S5]-alanine N-acetyltransferase
MHLPLRIEGLMSTSICAHNEQAPTLSLKELTVADVDDFMEWATDDEVTKYMMWNSYSSHEEAQKFILTVVQPHPWFKAICLGEKVVGSITLDKGKGIHSCKAEIGYAVAKRYWGQGLATQAVKLAIRNGFVDLDVERIEAFVDPGNVSSQRVLDKSGFVREGLLRNCVLQKGTLKSRYVYSVLRADN